VAENNRVINFRELFPDDALELANLMNADPEGYNEYFIPFDLNEKAIRELLEKKKADLYLGIYYGDDLAGCYMLRGFDAGYKIPSYGAYISSKFNNKGLATLTLFHAFSTCKLLSAPKLMLKVHPKNVVAHKLYEKYGFKETGFDDRIKNLILHKEF
jgi:RimJ/RimL family protein N-acetyltransferase